MKGYVFDMDGVIWDGDTPIPHASERINEIIKSGKKYVFMTNNALRSRDTYVKRLKQYGISTDKERVLISSYAAGLYIKRRSGASKVHAMGNEEMKDELRQAGHEIVDKGAEYVVVGLDKTVDYDKMTSALQNVLAGAELLACAPDVTYLDNGEIKMGSGAFARALEAASGKKMTVVGKPNTMMMEMAVERMGLKPDECISVGDKLATDIKVGKELGMKTALVLTGETSPQEAKKSDIKPDYILNDLRDLP